VIERKIIKAPRILWREPIHIPWKKLWDGYTGWGCLAVNLTCLYSNWPSLVVIFSFVGIAISFLMIYASILCRRREREPRPPIEETLMRAVQERMERRGWRVPRPDIRSETGEYVQSPYTPRRGRPVRF
jgi:hypothetical protein